MGTDLVPLPPSDYAEEPDVAGMLRAWDRAEFYIANPQGEYLVRDGGSDRVRGSVGGKSTRAFCESQGFPDWHIGTSGWHRSAGANNSIDR